MPITVEKPRKVQIQETAEELFRERGYSATSMRHLAAELGIEPASLYSHIKSKEEILSSICFGMADTFFAAIEPILKANKTNAQKLRAMIVAHTSVVLKNVNASTVFFHDWRHLSEPNFSEFKSLRKAYEHAFKQILAEGVANGEFAVADLSFCVKTLFSAMNMTHEWYKPEDALQHQEVGNKLANLLLNGIITNP
ncbi:MAG: TetR family transcriptional regulator [Bacteroidetes bacterium]|nr:TetR family transcriptional regulator [Bacteroidota bacterium]